MYKALNPFPCLLGQANSATIDKSYQLIVMGNQSQSGNRKNKVWLHSQSLSLKVKRNHSENYSIIQQRGYTTVNWHTSWLMAFVSSDKDKR